MPLATNKPLPLHSPSAIRPLRLVYLCAPRDQEALQTLEIRLRPLEKKGVFEPWHPGRIPPGSDRGEHIGAAVDSADLFLVILSPELFAMSDELDCALSAAVARARGPAVRLIPVNYRRALLRDTPLEALQMLPSEQAIGECGTPDAAWHEVASAIQNVMSEMQEQTSDLLTAYRAYVQTRCGELPGCYAPVPVCDIFVERTLIDPTGGPVSAAELVTAGRRTLLMGGPGIGKTMLLRYLAAILCADPRRLPVLCDGQELLTEDYHLDRLERALRRAGHPAGLRRLLEKHAADGDLVLLIDGLDCLAPERERDAVDLLQSWGQRWPAVAMVSSTRFIHKTPTGFHDVMLQPLDPVQRAALHERWSRHLGRDLPALEGESLAGLPLAWAVLTRIPALDRAALPEALVQVLLSGEHRGLTATVPHPRLIREVLTALARHLARDLQQAQTVDELEEILYQRETSLIGAMEKALGHPGARPFLEMVARATGLLAPYGPRSTWRFYFPELVPALAGPPSLSLSGGEDALAASLDETDEWQVRRRVYNQAAELLGDPGRAVRFLDRCRIRTRNGNDLFFLDRALLDLGVRFPQIRARAEAARDQIFHGFSLPMTDLLAWAPPGYGNQGRGQERSPWRALPGGALLSMVPVNRRQYRSFDPGHTGCLGTGAAASDGELPVTGITWFEAVMFCRWLASVPATARARLPTEAEWLSAHCGTAEDLRRGAVYLENSGRHVHFVGQRPANRAGFFDLPGNVREWCLDTVGESEYAGGIHAPRVVRGACFLDGEERLSAQTFWLTPPERATDLVGFRVLLPPRERTI